VWGGSASGSGSGMQGISYSTGGTGVQGNTPEAYLGRAARRPAYTNGFFEPSPSPGPFALRRDRTFANVVHL